MSVAVEFHRVPRRYKTLKSRVRTHPFLSSILHSYRSRLFHGNFILDNPVPKRFLNLCPNTNSHYSAATCDPNDLKDDDFTLHQVHYDPSRHTKLFIVMTMYHEDEELFMRSMHGVIKNIAHLCKHNRSKTWGKRRMEETRGLHRQQR